MKNIITILFILILPVAMYLLLTNITGDKSAIAFNGNNPSMILFSSTMCMDCQKMKSTIKEIENTYNDKINIIYIDALKKDKSIKDKIKKYGVTLVPTLVFTDANETQTKKIEGSISKDELVSSIEAAINE